MFKSQRLVQRQGDWIGLQRWYRDALGGLYSDAETALLAEILPVLFGYHIVALGIPSAGDLLASSPIAHRCRIDSVQYPSGPEVDVLAQPAQLPIASDSVDVVVVPHILEFVEEPHTVLREVDRILIPEGHMVILGFNRFSLWGLWWLLRSRRGKTPWDARFLSVTRVRDWLALLGFDTLAIHYCFYRPPLKHLSVLGKLTFLEKLGAKWWPWGGGGYVLLAKKRVSTLTPIQPRWRSRRRQLTEGIVNHPLGKYRGDQED